MKKTVTAVKKRPFIIAAAVILVIAIVLAAFFIVRGIAGKEKPFGTKIVFDRLYTPEPGTEFVYDAKSLSALLPNDQQYVYYNVIVDNYGSASALGFDESSYTEADWMRVYSDPDSGASLKIDRFGRFIYDPENAVRQYQTTNNDRYNFIVDVIEKCGLGDKISDGWSSCGDVVTDEYGNDAVITTAITVDSRISTDGRVEAKIGENGNVSEITCGIYSYGKSQKAHLISVKKAIEKIKKGQAELIVENEATRFEFEEISLKYMPQETADGDRMLQPVYEFSGTAISPSGESDSFIARVQANKY